MDNTIKPEIASEIWELFVWNGIDATMAHDRRAVKQLISLLGNTSGDARVKAAELLGNVCGASAVPWLIPLLGDEDNWVQDNVVKTLVKIGKQAVPQLISALVHENEQVRGNAARVLGNIGDADAISPLISALGDKNPRVRVSAVEALGDLGNADVIRYMIPMLKDKDGRVRCYTAEILISKCRSIPDLQQVKTGISEGVKHLRWQKLPSNPQACALLSKARVAMADLLQRLHAKRKELLQADTSGLTANNWKPLKTNKTYRMCRTAKQRVITNG